MTVRTNAEVRDFKFAHLLIRVRRNDVHGSTFGIHLRSPDGSWKDRADWSGIVTADLPTEARFLSEFLREVADRAPASNMPFETSDDNSHPALDRALERAEARERLK